MADNGELRGDKTWLWGLKTKRVSRVSCVRALVLALFEFAGKELSVASEQLFARNFEAEELKCGHMGGLPERTE